MSKGLIDALESMARKAASPKGIFGTHLHSNDAIISKVFEDRSAEAGGRIVGGHSAAGFMGGIPAAVKNMQGGGGLIDSVNLAHRTAEGGINYGAIAGSYIGVSAAARVASGGGAYKDRHGRTNIIGVPFF